MKAEEIIKILKENLEPRDFGFGDFDSEELGLGEVEEIEEVGGEGEGDHWHVVRYFKDHNVLLRLDGFYQSNYGISFDGWDIYKVTRKEKTVIVYE